YSIGEVDLPDFPIAKAVAASAAFPPVLAPVTLHFESGEVRPLQGAFLHREPFTRKVKLADGGVYDNQGMQRVVGKCRTVLVSDGRSPFNRSPNPSSFWPLLLMRTLFIMDSQLHALRNRLRFS